jgi:Ca-activated chloride channel homolog
VTPQYQCRRLIGLVAVGLVLSGAAWCQGSLSGPMETSGPNLAPRSSVLDELTHSLHLSVSLVLVPVQVIDAQDRPILTLGADAFSLFQDDQQQEIEYFTTEDSPISVGLILDLSKSMTNKFDAERKGVSEFFKNANSQDEFSVITFADRPKLITASAQSVEAVESRLALEQPDGDTAMLDAIWEGVERMKSAKYQRRCLLVISDGGDNHSRHHLRQLRKALEESDVEVYAIGIFDAGPFKTLEEAMGRKWLSSITDATGGHTIAVDKTSDLAGAAARISREMREEYVLGYKPSMIEENPGRRKIRVRVVPPHGSAPLRAFYKTGFVAESNAEPNNKR